MDDQPANLAVLEALLAGLDATLVSVGSGEAALRALLEEEFALVLLDVQMPAMDGLQTAELMRRDPRSQSVPIIFITAADPDGFPDERAYALGDVDHLAKPIKAHVLRARVNRCLALQRQAAELARLRSEAPARASEAAGGHASRLRLIVDNLHDYAFIGTDTERRITEWEAGAQAVTGWSAAEAIGQSADMLFLPEDRAAGQPDEEAARARATGRSEDRRWHLRRDGRRFFADGMMIALREKGQLRGYAKIMRDATAEHEAAEQLAASERALGESTERFARLLESSGEGIVGLDAGGRCTFLNAAGAACLGYTPEELAGQAVGKLLPARGAAQSDGDLEEGALLDALRNGSVLRLDDTHLLRKDGSILPVACSVHPLTTGAGPGGAVLTFTDISARQTAGRERERLMAQLRAAGERMRDIFYQAPAFMAVMRGPDMVFEMANQRFSNLVGRRALLGKPFHAALPELVGQGLYELLKTVYRSGEAHEGSNVRLQLQTESGELDTYYVDFIYMALREPDGSVSGVLIHGIDVTERTRANLLAVGQRGALELAVSDAPLDDVLDLLARTAEEYAGGAALAGVQLADAGGGLRHAAAPGLPDDLRAALDKLGMSPLGGAGGTAAWRAEPVDCPDIATDPLWERCRGPALAAGLAACRALPILSPAGSVLGAFTWYYRAGAARTARDEAALALLANSASLVIGQRAEAAARQLAEERSHAILESMTDGFLALDSSWRIGYANAAAERITGLDRSQLFGDVFWDLFPDWQGSRHEQACRRCAGERAATRTEAYLAAWGGWYEINCFPTPDGGIALYLRDESERRLAEEGVRRLAAVAEQSSDFIGIFAPNGSGLYLNPAGRAMAGLGLDADIGGTRLLDLFSKDCRAFVRTDVLPALRGGEQKWEGELKFAARGTGDAVPVYFKGFAVHGADGAHLGLATITRDITEQKRAEDELRRIAADLSEADHRKSEFLATLAHELRNPLAPIRTGLDLLRMAPANAATAAATAVRVHEMMDRQLGQLIHLVDDLLDIARITRGRIELKKEPIDLRTAVSMAVESSTALIHAGNHELQVTLPEEALPLDADLTRLVQVLSNLLNNAAKYTPGGGRISLAAWREGAQAVVAVTDSGIGIAPDAIGSVFEMFTQVRSSLDRAQGGLGIGLSLVRRLVELHGGRVHAFSEGRGRGSTFTVRLPLRRGAGEARDAVPGPAAQAPARRLRVLVVDDNQDAAESLVALIEALGHETRMAHDGPAGLAAAREFKPDLAFLDIGLPGMNGHEVARAIRASNGAGGALRDMMLVALTGWGAASDMTLSHQAGFDQHLTKPVSREALEQALATATDGRNLSST
ncbi:PAS domain S-box protein [Massilia litorea]|uniref:histidine kinase n=1 Tax=Massilia litorea TaxID=2769491 RepID=A0A7L9U152_9BURK|nr:PAS domain S-box protein [Massilia litorea]QOL48771.1 PAS domain S-box protein [Massilia litorea]